MINRQLEPCPSLNTALADEANDRRPGMSLFVLTNINTGEVTRSGVVIRSGVHRKQGVIANFCPFCGEDIGEQFEGENTDATA